MRSIASNTAVLLRYVQKSHMRRVPPCSHGQRVQPLTPALYKRQVQQDHVLVIYDDLDTPTAKTRLRPKGGHGGHNGMRSIVAMLGDSQDFARLRVGATQGHDNAEFCMTLHRHRHCRMAYSLLQAMTVGMWCRWY